MPWCPVCREEYREGFERCKDCDCALVAVLPPLPELLPLQFAATRRVYAPLQYPTLLTTTDDLVRLEVLLDLLEQAEIPASVTGDTTQRYLHTYTGVDNNPKAVYVEQTQLGQAQAMLDGYFSNQDELEGELFEDESPAQPAYGYPHQTPNARLSMKSIARWMIVMGVATYLLSILASLFEGVGL